MPSEEPRSEWTKGWIIANTLATVGAAVTGFMALVISVAAFVIAVTS